MRDTFALVALVALVITSRTKGKRNVGTVVAV